jgi:hypothetical protein
MLMNKVDSFLASIVLLRDPVNILYSASLHILEQNRTMNPATRDALNELHDARLRVVNEKVARVLQTSTLS